jgi:hypothetical protein
MQARRLPALRGGQWIIDGFRLYRRNPPLLTLLALNYWLFFLLIFILPFVGPFAANILLQALSVTVMNGCRAADEGRKVAMDIVWSGFKRNLRTLLRLGALYLAGEMAAAAILLGAFGTDLMPSLPAGDVPSPGIALDEERLMPFLYGALALTLPLMLAFWFAPMLAAWHDLPARKALFFSVVAVLRNWRAFAAYGAGALLLTAVVPGVVRALFGFSDTLLTLASTVVTMALVFVAMPTLFASVYMSYRDVFADDVQAPAGD